MNDSELFDSWLKGNRAAGLALLGKYRLGWVRYLRKPLGMDYEDLLQQALLACVEGHRNFRIGGNFGSYTFGILKNQLRDKKRKWYREHKLTDALRTQTTAVVNIKSKNDDKFEAVEAAMERLPPQLREVLVMRFVMKMTRDHVARSLAIPSGTVASRERRAKAKLLELLAARSSSSDDEIGCSI